MTNFNYVTTTGIVTADTSDVKATVQGEWAAALGDSINLDDSTPQGLLIVAETSSRVATLQAIAKSSNQINPKVAGGVFLDALCALTGITRIAATYTTVTLVKLTGVANTSIASGTRARIGTSGAVFELQTGVQLDNTGTAYGTFVCQTSGAVACADGALNTPVDTILGWETVNNDQSLGSVTTLGADREKDTLLRLRRNNSLAAQGISTPQAVISNLYSNTDGVTSVAFLENVTSVTQTINGIPLVAHSIWVCVDGGTDADVAATLLRAKTVGAAWNGSTSVAVTDPSSGQIYNVQFDRPTYVFIYGAITLRQGSYTGDLAIDAPAAVADYFSGNVDGFSGIGIGASVSPWEIAAAIVAACPGCIVTGLKVGTVAGSLSAATIAIAINQRAQTNTGAFVATVQS